MCEDFQKTTTTTFDVDMRTSLNATPSYTEYYRCEQYPGNLLKYDINGNPCDSVYVYVYYVFVSCTNIGAEI